MKMLSEKEYDYWDRIRKQVRKTKIEKSLNEITNMLILIGGFIIIIILSGYAGYGALHYFQGIALMSSPELLMAAFTMSGLTALLMTTWFLSLFKNNKD